MLSIKNSILLRKKWITAENRDKTWLALQSSLSLKLTAMVCDLKRNVKPVSYLSLD